MTKQQTLVISQAVIQKEFMLMAQNGTNGNLQFTLTIRNNNKLVWALFLDSRSCKGMTQCMQ